MTELILSKCSEKPNLLPSLQNLSAYKNYVASIPNMSEEEEQSLFKQFQTENCLNAVQKIILSQLKTVVYIAYQFKNYGLPEEDLIQEGNIGLMKAVKNFSLDHKVRLYSYALIWIKAEIQGYILKNWKLVKIGTTKNLKKLFFNFKSLQKELIDSGIEKSKMASIISKRLNVDIKDVNEIEQYFNNDDIIIDVDSEESPILQIGHNETPETLYMDKHDNNKKEEALKKVLTNLNEKQQYVINMRFLSENKKTHKEIGEIIGVSSERVRQIEMESISKMKKIFIDEYAITSY